MNEKCVIIIDGSLTLGEIANTAAILGITLGGRISGSIGEDVYDSAGNLHTGIIKIPVPVLKASRETLKSLRLKLFDPPFSELTTVDFTDLAQSCKTYDEFIGKMSSSQDLNYIGLAIFGDKKMVTKLTGNLPLMK